MSHGGLPARRPDQHDSATPRSTAPGARLQQIANNKGLPITVEIINKPGDPVVTQDGGIPGALSAFNIASSGATVPLIPASVNVAGLLLWSASISSAAAGTPGAQWVAADDILTTGASPEILLACMLGQGNVPGQVANSNSQQFGGIPVPAGQPVVLVNGGSSGTPVLRQCTATVVYTVLA